MEPNLIKENIPLMKSQFRIGQKIIRFIQNNKKRKNRNSKMIVRMDSMIREKVILLNSHQKKMKK
jgi:hypothetical protein